LYESETWALTLREEPRLELFENRVLMRTVGLKRDEVTAGRRKRRNEDLHNLYSSPITIRMIMSRNMKRAGHVAHMGEVGRRGMNIGFLWGCQKERDHYKDLDIGGRIIVSLV
jgi:hypothetical protein